MSTSFNNSYIYVGNVSHRRFSPKKHSFNYSLYMLALDIEDIEKSNKGKGLFGFSWFKPLRFVEKDYLRDEPNGLRQRISNKVNELNGYSDVCRIVMLVQVRCFGVYFSPANFYFCYDARGKCTQMLAEVSNTPWNERHYYLVDLVKDEEKITNKDFQVSPFMDLDMFYKWQITPPSDNSDRLKIHIENKRRALANQQANKLFDATLSLQRKAFSQKNLLHVWMTLPAMTIKVVMSIYWQALKLFFKRVPFIGYQKSN
ncbi:DUF1365 domain-containing protein [Paraglaciecola aquimarina]|uniref:DUF1365 domain-containing protein n=1 Tax=Paraglaciecola algarum TaxID=3050085 RepID=A0ABS9DA12_9ALTE|nr:DUF1365 domain-containing protein [Paraglaciecola sp. G1-23]MCF2949803.1 DUF1365 domain-containing protein [Paraglaciecola sp. G1-23]